MNRIGKGVDVYGAGAVAGRTVSSDQTRSAMEDDLEIEENDGYDYEDEDGKEFDCYGHFSGGVFHCGAVGSEECELECPYNDWLGKTRKQIDREEARSVQAGMPQKEEQ